MQWPIFNYYKMRTNQFQMAPLDMSGKRERPTAKVDNVAFSVFCLFVFLKKKTVLTLKVFQMLWFLIVNMFFNGRHTKHL